MNCARVSEIVRTEAIPICQTAYGTLFNDRVRGPTGQPGRYLRWRWSQAGVVVIPRRGNLVGLCWMHRYPAGLISLEAPRGGRAGDEPVEDAARRELREETGLIAQSCRVIGTIFPETGLLDAELPIVEAWVMDRSEPVDHEALESIQAEIIWKECQEIRSAVRGGEIKCGITIAALTFLDWPTRP